MTTAVTEPLITERQMWALMVGEYVIRLAVTSQLMRHSNPAASVMYCDPNREEWEPAREAAAAVLDFAAWCARGTSTCEEARRFMAFADAILGGNAMATLIGELQYPTETAASVP